MRSSEHKQFTLEEYQQDSLRVFDLAGEIGKVEIVGNDGNLVMTIDRQNPRSDEVLSVD